MTYLFCTTLMLFLLCLKLDPKYVSVMSCIKENIVKKSLSLAFMEYFGNFMWGYIYLSKDIYKGSIYVLICAFVRKKYSRETTLVKGHESKFVGKCSRIAYFYLHCAILFVRFRSKDIKHCLNKIPDLSNS